MDYRVHLIDTDTSIHSYSFHKEYSSKAIFSRQFCFRIINNEEFTIFRYAGKVNKWNCSTFIFTNKRLIIFIRNRKYMDLVQPLLM